MSVYQKKYMELAIEEARVGIHNGHGGPFGAVIVKDGKEIACGHNHVLAKNDSTCHGEIEAIRLAEQELASYDLTGCELYTTAEPCPMCLAAILWANVGKVYYGCSVEDTEMIGFRDKKFEEMLGQDRKLGDLMEQHDREMCLDLFDEYNKIDKTIY